MQDSNQDNQGQDNRDNIIPLRPQNNNVNDNVPPMFNLPPYTSYLMGIILGLHLIVAVLPNVVPFLPDQMWWVYNFGFVPARMSDAELFNWLTPFTPITYAFLHAGWLHVATNLLMLAAFGAGIEKQYSGKMLLGIFIAGSVFAALLHFIFAMHGTDPVIGASGGISALFGAVLIMLKSQGALNRSNSLLPIIGVWLGVTIIFGLMGGPDGAMIAWVAHIGGFVGGLGLMHYIVKGRG